MMEDKIFCQSCGMPLNKDADFGTDAGGAKNDEYCVYCYKEGKFTEDLTMDGMIERCITFVTARAAEVEGRFALDAMPGRMMNVDRDLNAGLINEEQARERREKISRDAERVADPKNWEEEARKKMREWFPTLKRWKVA